MQVGEEARERRASIATACLRTVPPRRGSECHTELEAVVQQPEQLDPALQRVSPSTMPRHVGRSSALARDLVSVGFACEEAATAPVLELLDRPGCNSSPMLQQPQVGAPETGRGETSS